MRFTRIVSSISLPALVLCAVAACEQGGGKSAKSGLGIVQPLADSTVILKYNGGQITAKDVNEAVKPQLKRFEEEALEAYKNGAQRTLVMKLLNEEAKKQGVGSPEALMQKMLSEVSVSDDQAKEFIKTQHIEKGIPDPKTGKMRKVSLEEVKGYLAEQERQNKQQSFLQGLLAQANAEIALEEPRAQVKLNGDEPFKGGANAKVVIQEFSDFQCPFCARGKTVVDQISQAYGDKVKIVFRHFPLEFHAQAKPAALAATCAQKQGKFWEFHDKLFENQRDLSPPQGKSMTPDETKAYVDGNLAKQAKEAGVDLAKWEACYKSQETAAKIDADMAIASEAGVNSTPTFFVNGKRVAGALPFEQFKSMIDSELKKL